MNEQVKEKESYIDEAKRRIAHLSYKLEQSEKRVRKLEFDNAELTRWADDICLPRLQELSDDLVSRYNQKKYRKRNWKDELNQVREDRR
jgi:small-conductance mechanosensitive channel|tara:strand:+ start:1931 stop:2197 length:267 start_codon:yes stop_codon:yes gene_type:complete